jgi:hypothetical protein
MMERFRVLTVMAIVGIALGGCANQASPSPEPGNVAATPDATQSRAHEECEDEAIVEHAFSASDDSDLVGFADNVFVGRVERRVGDEPLESRVVPDPDGPEGPAPSTPQTQFSVEVLENVKGKLGGAVTVSQQGAYDPERGCVTLMEDDPLLEPGQEILFFTRRDEKRGWHQIFSAGYGDVRIEDEQHREDLVWRFERAHKNQTDPTPGRH